jgi:UDP-glucose 4-epimerase
MTILVTGGAGYIGSHACRRLLADGCRVIALDNLLRGHQGAIDKLMSVAQGRLEFVRGDIGDRAVLDSIFKRTKVNAVLHFAALTYVGESVTEPLRYYRANTASALNLLEAVDAAGVPRFIFSSTCATFGEPTPEFIPIPEHCPQKPINPYGASKLQFERMLIDYAAQTKRAGKPFAFAALRYFNVAGCDRSGLLGEHHDPETHIIPVILQVILGQRDALTVFGTDYPTPDGTCIRDYVHVDDLIDAHVAVLAALKDSEQRFYNVGIGTGYSVKQIIDSVKRVTGKDFPIKHGPRRPGDPPMLFNQPAKIKAELGWTARVTDLDEIVASAWRWFRDHPRGYGA